MTLDKEEAYLSCAPYHTPHALPCAVIHGSSHMQPLSHVIPSLVLPLVLPLLGSLP